MMISNAVKTLVRPLRLRLNALRQNKKIENFKKELSNLGFLNLVYLGSGKDSVVFSADYQDSKVVVKKLTEYFRNYISRTKAVTSSYKGSEFYELTFINESILFYKFEELESSNLNAKSLLQKFSKVCEFQTKLINNGFLMWDFGITGVNYMFKNEDLRIIDYGGNSFIPLNDNSKIRIENCRLNLQVANNNFIQQSLLLHFIVFGLGQTPAAKWASWIQDNADLETSKLAIQKYLKSTIYENLSKKVFSIDLLKADSWINLKNFIEAYFDDANVNVALDAAEIDKVEFFPNKAEVRGYQNYTVYKDNLSPLELGHEWAKTNEKWTIVNTQLKKWKFKSYLDIGSNLGIYVFTAGIFHKSQAKGIDYNSDYINQCNQIAKHLNLNCSFEIKEFGKIDEIFDCVTMLGVIHHIYNRTESFGNLETIVKKISDMSNHYAIIEFPTENDLKAMKWITVPSRVSDSDYTLENFILLAKKYFKNIEKIGEVTKDRPIFSLSKL